MDTLKPLQDNVSKLGVKKVKNVEKLGVKKVNTLSLFYTEDLNDTPN